MIKDLIDTGLYYKYLAVKDARIYLNGIYEMLDMPHSDYSRENLKRIFLTSQEYRIYYDRAFQSAVDSQEYQLNNTPDYMDLISIPITVKRYRSMFNIDYLEGTKDTPKKYETGVNIWGEMEYDYNKIYTDYPQRVYFYSQIDNWIYDNSTEQGGEPPASVSQYPEVDYKLKKNTAAYITGIGDDSSPMSLQDLIFIKRMSLARLSLLSQCLSGDELLSYRCGFAEQDLKKLNSIKASINNAYNVIENQINSFFIQEYIPESAGNVPYFPYMFGNTTDLGLINGFHKYSYGVFWLTTECDIILKEKGEILKRYNAEVALPVNYTSSLLDQIMFVQAKQLNNNGIDLIKSMIKTQINWVNVTSDLQGIIKNNAIPDHKDYLITAAAELADWEIQLRAHILAGGGE